MERIKKIVYKEKQILSIDYSGCKEDEMIELVTAVRNLIQHENKEVLIVSIFNKNYATPKYIKHLESELTQIEKLIKKNAVTGLSKPQLWILKGLNMLYKMEIYHFDTKQKALDFLVE